MIKVFCDEKCDFYLAIAKFAYKFLDINGKCSVELVIADGERIRRLNSQFRGIDKETDVLSFPSIDFAAGIDKLDKKNYPLEYDSNSNTVALGSIVINENMAQKQADEYGHSLSREKAYLFLHGLLHIFGYDHIENDDKKIMRSIEEKVLDKLGLGIESEKGE